MQHPLISLILPIYNSELYIHDCINSILNQSYKQLEIILINDGSTDGSANICNEYSLQYPSLIKTLHEANRGASYARKKGLEICNGEYITFIDSDDIVEYDYVEHLYDALQNHHTQIAACNMIKHTKDKNINIIKNKRSILLEETELHNRFFNYELWGFWGKIFHKDVFNDIYFPKATINEDYVVMAQLFHKYKEIAYIDIPLYHYLIHNNESLSNTQLSLKMMDEWINKLWTYQFYQRENSKWMRHAEAQVAESCCKLIHAIGNNKEYHLFKKEMQSFLKEHFFSLIKNKNLIRGIKLIIPLRIIQ